MPPSLRRSRPARSTTGTPAGRLRSRSPATSSARSGESRRTAMLDALVAEARLRWGLDLAAGLQVIAAEHLAGTPLEPSRPALIVPAAILRIDPELAEGPDGLAAPVLPGRHGHGNDPVAVLRRLYPADHPVGR